MKRFIILFLCLVSLNCYSQSSWTMQVWKKNGGFAQFKTENIDSVTFVKNSDIRDWEEIMNFPSEEDINYVNNTNASNSANSCRSPYLTAWLNTGIEGGFSAYSVDFKADYQPEYTYCSLANLHFDYSYLLEKYDSVTKDSGISAYAGFQRQDAQNRNAILSIWNMYCHTASGQIDTIRASLVEPANSEVINYSHEGKGVSYHPTYDWRPGKWYRILIQCAQPQDGGNTKLEFWVYDLEVKKVWTKFCVFDLGTPNIRLKNNAAVFLENWSPKTSGEIRTLEFKNVRIYINNRWENIYSGYFNDREDHDNIHYSGSYQYGCDDSTFWMITTGVPDCAESEDGMTLSVTTSEGGSPF